jgi:hypothetical protein
MQTILKRGSAASRVRSAGLSVAIVAGASIVATFSFFVPNSALAACSASHSAGVHTASANTGAHTATSIAAPSGASSAGGGSLGCATESSATGLRGLPTAASGKVVEGGAHAARPATHARTAPTTRSTNATAHLHTVKPAHRG